ncbi:endonuclease/exonuclease/phosphatase family protein [endosymbiont of Ridgeia piscesae]|jgi:endonuclease/exonuclease/phosphatase family metal-dependent hydrolase|uniref:Metal-dependent hydrolase, endonuclease/exonuclease/phosphatase family n=1 Tax=endosymbiont of Ridgeia piscesae TaxID=54398 RepID=A0A0T5Z9I2_9GAMM|nr:endonuclease/exonuclease/phosphatase family protein [endosymbiont of Ridgeia piscesae]KRT54880.1 Metal-dependent hydrolase, endonuclease/exonuclease/phosphatase family [endosymbiont of Ridgeia piscesae]KRT59439.1 Metal-dependent hydrolase, endonuclease/exonuclease/phosphatase family [endosymbiont of Ridgeia piscesae]
MIRIATFNIENLDGNPDQHNPQLEARIPVLKSSLKRLQADILCLQEVHGQELPGHTAHDPKRNLSALDRVLEGTDYAGYERAFTRTSDDAPYNKRNLVILSRFPITQVQQYRNDHIDKLQYRKVTALPPEPEARDLRWERPILHAQIEVPELGQLHLINLHLKSRLATKITNQTEGYYGWKSAAAWAEGYFLSSIKRVGQALETRILLDKLFDQEPAANILVCGDFNAEPGEVPVEAIAGRVENTNNPELRSRVLIPCSRSIPDSVRFSHYHHGQGNLLDHMLISQSLLPHFQDTEIHNENLHDESLPASGDRKFPESDHAGFVAAFDY